MTENNEGPVFRASKRRRIFRKRPDGDDGDDGGRNATTTPAEETEPVAGAESTESAGLKQRRPIATRKGGVAFSSSESRRHVQDPQETSSSLVAQPDAVEHAQARFVAPTGHLQTTDDKHMMAYVDSKLARLHSSSTPTDDLTPSETPLLSPKAVAYQSQFPHAAYGELQEVDLPSASSSANPKAQQTRSTKPTRSRRQPARRNSADLARDAMVEQILRESRLEIYDSSSTAPKRDGRPGQNEDADERMAEEFKRNFYAAAEAKHTRRPPPPPSGAKTKTKPDSLKGPKLGGSRSQRAQMHASEKAKANANKAKK